MGDTGARSELSKDSDVRQTLTEPPRWILESALRSGLQMPGMTALSRTSHAGPSGTHDRARFTNSPNEEMTNVVFMIRKTMKR